MTLLELARLRRICLGFALTVCAFNYAGVIGGWMNAPAGYEPAFMNRYEDLGQYLTWAKASQSQVFIPNYHAPFDTKPALFNPLLLTLSRISLFLGIEFVHVYVAAHVFGYLLCGFGLYRCLRTFFTSFGGAMLAIAFMLCSIPAQSLFAAPLYIATGAVYGMRPFLGETVDGFLHAMPGSILVTVATGFALLSFSAAGRYIETHDRRELQKAGALIFLGAFLHPFEVFVSTGAVCATLLILRRSRIAVWDSIFIALAGLGGLAPYGVAAFIAPWIADAAQQNRWIPPSPAHMIILLGPPTIACLALLLSLIPAKVKLNPTDIRNFA